MLSTRGVECTPPEKNCTCSNKNLFHSLYLVCYWARVLFLFVLLCKNPDHPSLLLREKELLRGPDVEQKILADPTTRIAMLSHLGGAYLMLWRERWETPPRSGMNSKDPRSLECRVDVSAERSDLLRQAQRFFEEALNAPENLNDPAFRAQVGQQRKKCTPFAKNASSITIRPYLVWYDTINIF